MATTNTNTRRILALAAAASLAFAACVPGPTPSPTAGPTSGLPVQPSLPPSLAPSPSAAPRAGGTIYLLMESEQFGQVDPQRIYGSEDEAFFGATLYRSLESYVVDPDPTRGTLLQPDLATDLGTATDGGRIWSFTLRDGVSFEDGSAIRCEDVAYAVSRTFATDVINQGPTYAILDLDIPMSTDGASAYPGPYRAKPTQQAQFDRAVTCSADHRTITFHLNRPVGDFNYATTLGMSPVPRAADTGETYGLEKPPVSSGPYTVQSYKPGRPGSMVLVRNAHWDPASDPIRKAYPDRWEVDFAIDPNVLDQRLISARGNDATALLYGTVQPVDLTTIFSDEHSPSARFAGRAFSDADPYARYLWIDVQKVPNVKVRQAIMVALDREAIREIRGGAFYGTYADGVIKPTIGMDYAPTGIWDSYFGTTIPASGDPALGRKLIAESGEAVPAVTFAFPDSPLNQRAAEVVTDSLGKAGIKVTATPLCTGYGCGLVLDPTHAAAMGLTGWGADWPSASTVIPFLFTEAGGWDLSRVNDPLFNTAVQAAESTTDRAAQATQWQALNQRAVEQAWVVPTFFGLSQTIAGTKVGPLFRWPAYGSWPYPVLSVEP